MRAPPECAERHARCYARPSPRPGRSGEKTSLLQRRGVHDSILRIRYTPLTRRKPMNRKFVWIVLAALVLAVAVPVLAEEEKKPGMSAEEQAMMEAWMKAGTPGPAHKLMAE